MDGWMDGFTHATSVRGVYTEERRCNKLPGFWFYFLLLLLFFFLELVLFSYYFIFWGGETSLYLAPRHLPLPNLLILNNPPIPCPIKSQHLMPVQKQERSLRKRLGVGARRAEMRERMVRVGTHMLCDLGSI